jgi:hypothetical protein
MVEALDGRRRVELVFVAAEADLALGLPGERLDRAEFVRAAQRLDGLVEDCLYLLVVRPPDGTSQARHKCRHQHGTEEPFHGLPHLSREGKNRTRPSAFRC